MHFSVLLLAWHGCQHKWSFENLSQMPNWPKRSPSGSGTPHAIATANWT
jgi:hypothetical protein